MPIAFPHRSTRRPFGPLLFALVLAGASLQAMVPAHRQADPGTDEKQSIAAAQPGAGANAGAAGQAAPAVAGAAAAASAAPVAAPARVSAEVLAHFAAKAAEFKVKAALIDREPWEAALVASRLQALEQVPWTELSREDFVFCAVAMLSNNWEAQRAQADDLMDRAQASSDMVDAMTVASAAAGAAGSIQVVLVGDTPDPDQARIDKAKALVAMALASAAQGAPGATHVVLVGDTPERNQARIDKANALMTFAQKSQQHLTEGLAEALNAQAPAGETPQAAEARRRDTLSQRVDDQRLLRVLDEAFWLEG